MDNHSFLTLKQLRCFSIFMNKKLCLTSRVTETLVNPGGRVPLLDDVVVFTTGGVIDPPDAVLYNGLLAPATRTRVLQRALHLLCSNPHHIHFCITKLLPPSSLDIHQGIDFGVDRLQVTHMFILAVESSGHYRVVNNNHSTVLMVHTRLLCGFCGTVQKVTLAITAALRRIILVLLRAVNRKGIHDNPALLFCIVLKSKVAINALCSHCYHFNYQIFIKSICHTEKFDI